MTPIAPRRRLLTALPFAALLVAAACGGSDDSAATTTPATTSTAAAPTSPAPSSSVPRSTTTAGETTTTTVVPSPTWPLTGLPVADPADLTPLRRALVVKIDNNAAAEPQIGLNQADIVYEEVIEQFTRFAAVFHSQGSDPVGPIRSGRTQDVLLLESLNKPLFLWSGGNAKVTRTINDSELVNLSQATANGPAGFFRDRRGKDVKSEHTLFALTSKAWEASPAELSPPPPQFSYTDTDHAPEGLPATHFTVDMDGTVRWTYDEATTRWVREQRGRPHVDDKGVQISAENVVVLYVDYQPSAADARSPEAQTIGSGEALVFDNGVVVQGRWSRADEHSPWTLTRLDGTTIDLSPGNTWVELAHQDSVSDVGA